MAAVAMCESPKRRSVASAKKLLLIHEPRVSAGSQMPYVRCVLARGSVVSIQLRTLYTSENGDRWSLGRDLDTGRIFVRHEPNRASGGRSSDADIGAFLAEGRQGPEHQELLHLIGTLLEEYGSRSGGDVST
jgi:hypothetical protein